MKKNKRPKPSPKRSTSNLDFKPLRLKNLPDSDSQFSAVGFKKGKKK
jgi:hypothetical protein